MAFPKVPDWIQKFNHNHDEQGRFAKANVLDDERMHVQNQIQKLIEGVATVSSTHPTTRPHHVAAAKEVLSVLTEMKAKGLEMPHHVLIRSGAGDKKINAVINGYNIKDGAGNLIRVQKDLTIEIPENLPEDVNLDDAVAAVFGEKVATNDERYGRINDTMSLAPVQEDWIKSHPDSLYPTYDRYTARTMRDIIIHEMGHVQAGHLPELDIAPLLQSGKFPATLAIRRAMLRVSVYAAYSANEFIAESFTRLYRGETLADDSMKLYEYLNGPKVKK